MEVKLQITTPKQLAKFVEFWHETNANPLFDPNDTYHSFLFQAIDAHLLNPDVVTKQTVLEDVVDLDKHFNQVLDAQPDDYELQEQALTIRNFLATALNDPEGCLYSAALATPTKHFKELCGPEWMNKQGKMSRKSAKDFFEQQCKMRHIRQANGKIYLDDWARNLFQITDTEIYTTSLFEHINGLFL